MVVTPCSKVTTVPIFEPRNFVFWETFAKSVVLYDFTMGKSEVTSKAKSRRKWLWRLVQRWKWSLFLSTETLRSEKHLLNLLCFTISHDFTMGKSEVTNKHNSRRKWLWRLVQGWIRILFLSPETLHSWETFAKSVMLYDFTWFHYG